MTQQLPDLLVRVKALAEKEGPCPTYYSTNIEPPPKYGPDKHSPQCVCGGTGRIALFKELRVPACSNVGLKPHWHHGVHYGKTYDCAQGWVPEPDVEKACWRLLHVIGPGELILSWDTLGRVYCSPDTEKRHEGSFVTLEEAVISAAEAWAREAQRG